MLIMSLVLDNLILSEEIYNTNNEYRFNDNYYIHIYMYIQNVSRVVINTIFFFYKHYTPEMCGTMYIPGI